MTFCHIVGMGFGSLIDHDFLLVTDSSGNLAHSFISRHASDPDWFPAAFTELAPVLAYMRDGHRAFPEKAIPLIAVMDSSGAVKIGGTPLKLSTGAHNDAFGIGITGDVNVREV